MGTSEKMSFEEAQEYFNSLRKERPESLEALFFIEDLKHFNPAETFLIKEMELRRYQTSQFPMDTMYHKAVSRLLTKDVLAKLKNQGDEVR